MNERLDSNPRGSRSARTLFALAILNAAALASAAEIRLAWNPSPDPHVTAYVLYSTTNLLTEATARLAARLNVGTNNTWTITNLTAGLWTFGVTAATPAGTNVLVESSISPTLHVEVPRPPDHLRTVIVEYSVTLTNFSPVGFLRMRLP